MCINNSSKEWQSMRTNNISRTKSGKNRINKRKYNRNFQRNNWGAHKKKRRFKRVLLVIGVIAVCALIASGIFWVINSKDRIAEYESAQYSASVFLDDLPVEKLCVTNEDVEFEKFQTEDDFHAVVLFDIDGTEILSAENIHDKIYPASTTKILTAYLALKYGNLDEIVTISNNAVNVPSDSSKAWLKLGDQLTLEELLYGLMLPSGNDAAVAIAEHISGSVEAFAKLMNEEAKKLGATNSNFVSPHGYQDEEHYTTAYDLYLIFNQCIQNEKFLEIVSSYAYEVKIQESNGSVRDTVWRQSNQYVIGVQKQPEGIDVIGGKTGTTDEAGACLIQLVKDEENTSYISMIMGADNRSVLYKNMTNLLAAIK